MTDENTPTPDDRPDIDLDKARRGALRRKDYDAEVLKVTNGLNPKEKQLCQNVAVFGAAFLRDQLGWAVDVCRQFLERAEVQREIEQLTELYKDRTGIQERTQFFAQLKINGMVPAALTILAKAMRGHVINEDGTVKERAPDRNQIEAAMQVLDRANIQGAKYNPAAGAPPIDARSVHIHTDSVAKGIGLDGQSREKLGRLLNKFVGRAKSIVQADERVAERRRKADDVKDATPDDEDEDGDG